VKIAHIQGRSTLKAQRLPNRASPPHRASARHAIGPCSTIQKNMAGGNIIIFFFLRACRASRKAGIGHGGPQRVPAIKAQCATKGNKHPKRSMHKKFYRGFKTSFAVDRPLEKRLISRPSKREKRLGVIVCSDRLQNPC